MEYCDQCRQQAFVIDGVLQCCGRLLEARQASDFQIMVAFAHAKRKPRTKRFIKELLASQGNKCLYCGAEFGTFRKIKGKFYPEPVRLVIDHVVPFVYGGDTTEFAAACSRCNGHKSDRMFDNLKDIQTYCQALYA